MAQYAYQSLEFLFRPEPMFLPVPREFALGAPFCLGERSPDPFDGQALSIRVEREINFRNAEIQNVMPSKGGVLLCVGLKEADSSHEEGHQAFLSLDIAGSGQEAKPVLHDYLNRPKVLLDAPNGYRRRDAFLWVTPS